jgi:hypothetical protein
MPRSRAADDFAAIRARMAELRRERSPAAPDYSFEPYRPPLGRGPVTLDERELLRRISDRGPFSR